MVSSMPAHPSKDKGVGDVNTHTAISAPRAVAPASVPSASSSTQQEGRWPMTSHQSKMVHLLNKEPSISGSRRGDLPDASEAFTPSRYEQKDSEKRKTPIQRPRPSTSTGHPLQKAPRPPGRTKMPSSKGEKRHVPSAPSYSEHDTVSQHTTSRPNSVPPHVKEDQRKRKEKARERRRGRRTEDSSESETSSIYAAPISPNVTLPDDNKTPRKGDKGVATAFHWTTDIESKDGNVVMNHPLPPVPTWNPRSSALSLANRVRMGLPDSYSPRANQIAVPHPRQWGVKTQESRLESPKSEVPTPVSTVDDGGWGYVHDSLQKWAHNVPPAPPPETPPAVSKSSETSSDISRPDSGAKILPPVTVLYSEDEDAESPPALKPVGAPKRSKAASTNDNSAVKEADSVKSEPQDAINTNKPDPAVSNLDTRYADGPAVRRHVRSNSRLSYATYHTHDSTFTASGRVPPPVVRTTYNPKDKYSQREKWWKRESHPIWSPEFASRRLFVRLPFPVRNEDLKRTMWDHFNHYGPLRCAVPTSKVDRESTDRVVVVFRESESVQRALADPLVDQCDYKPSYQNRVGPIKLELQITHNDKPDLRYVWIRVSDFRWDSRARSASPTIAAQDDGGWGDNSDSNPLPMSVSIYATPRYLTKHDYWVRRAVVAGPFRDDKQRHEYEEQHSAVFLEDIPLGRRVPQKEFIPKLVDYFVDIYDMIPPSDHCKAWLVGVSADGEARHLMNALSPIQGITSRFARDDELLTAMDPAPESGDSDLASHSDSSGIADDAASAASSARQLTAEKTLPDPQASPPQPAPVTPSRDASVPHPDEHFPNLVRKVVLTYRGRIVREEFVDGQPRYIDDAAIFVGRLVKEQETTISLLKRFERHGKIASVEYSPHTCTGTYAIARVLFQTPAAAQAAIEWENGAVSFGSAIKVEPRKVLPMDVQAREMFLDPSGRAVSPSMAHQYSPPSPSEVVPQPRFPIPPSMAPPRHEDAHRYWVPGTGYWPGLIIPPAYLPPGVPSPEDPTSRVLPQMMWQFGFGWYGPPPPKPSEQQDHSAPQTQLSPSMSAMSITRAHTPPQFGYPLLPAQVGPQAANAPPATSSAPNVPATSSAMQEGPQPAAVLAASAPPPSKNVTDGDETASQQKLRPLGSKIENGMLKVIYDPEELKQYREEHGIKEEDSPPPRPISRASPPATQPYEEPILPLLPLSTGGHDLQRPASQMSSYYDNSFNDSRGPRDFNRSFTRMSTGPTGSQFPDPIGPHGAPFSRQSMPPGHPGWVDREQQGRMGGNYRANRGAGGYRNQRGPPGLGSHGGHNGNRFGASVPDHELPPAPPPVQFDPALTGDW